MNDLQRRLWARMNRLLEDYRNERIQFYNFVGELEGAFETAEFRDKAFTKRWYELWTKLETRRAVQGNKVSKDEVEKDLQALQAFLIEHADDVEDSPRF